MLGAGVAGSPISDARGNAGQVGWQTWAERKTIRPKRKSGEEGLNKVKIADRKVRYGVDVEKAEADARF